MCLVYLWLYEQSQYLGNIMVGLVSFLHAKCVIEYHAIDEAWEDVGWVSQAQGLPGWFSECESLHITLSYLFGKG
jgi:hypothetical protein